MSKSVYYGYFLKSTLCMFKALWLSRGLQRSHQANAGIKEAQNLGRCHVDCGQVWSRGIMRRTSVQGLLQRTSLSGTELARQSSCLLRLRQPTSDLTQLRPSQPTTGALRLLPVATPGGTFSCLQEGGWGRRLGYIPQPHLF